MHQIVKSQMVGALSDHSLQQRWNRIGRTLILGLVCLCTSLLAAGDAPEELPWLSPEQGLPRALKLRQPLLVLLESPANAGPARHLEQQLGNSSAARLLKDVVLIRIEWVVDSSGDVQWPVPVDSASAKDGQEHWSRKRARKVIESALGPPSRETVVAVLDLFGRKRARLEGKNISSSTLKKVLRQASQESRMLSRKSAAATKLLDRATLVLGKEDTASCCRLLTEVTGLELPPEAPPEQRRVELLKMVEKLWQKAMDQAKELERKNRLGEAASALEMVLKKFPHEAWEKQTRAEIGRVWKRIQGPGGGI